MRLTVLDWLSSLIFSASLSQSFLAFPSPPPLILTILDQSSRSIYGSSQSGRHIRVMPMAFQSLTTVLGSVQQQYTRRDRQQLQIVMREWTDIVGSIVAAQTRPVSIYRDVLKVSTSSAAWAQNLVFERQRILAKLNQKLASQLVDIRFSPAQWQRSQATATSPGEQQQVELWRSHPSHIAQPLKQAPVSSEPADAMTAFRQWETVMRSRSSQLPLCPECRCPTPVGELQRWNTCGLCAAKRWR